MVRPGGTGHRSQEVLVRESDLLVGGRRTMISTNEHQPLSNSEVASALDEVADLLEAQEANPFRVRAYRGAADTTRSLDAPLNRLLETGGATALTRLPGIGRSLAHSIEQLVRAGRLPLLERLRGEDAAEKMFATVPDIGPRLAQRIHEQLGIETLSELEAAAYDGRLERLRGMGSKRIRAVRESLAGRHVLEHRKQTRYYVDQPISQIPVRELLDIDAEYRRLAELGKLPRIAPRRFNPTGDAWLPVLHTERAERHYTALYSNTARAHEFGMTHDWVVIYRDDHDDHSRWTVITARFGLLRGKRVVRGREEECAEYYERMALRPHHQTTLFEK